MTGSKEYLPDTPAFFENLIPYVGFLKPELLRCFRYFAYMRHGKNWRQGEDFVSINFLIRSIELNKRTPDKFTWDIKKNKLFYRMALFDLLTLINESRPHHTETLSLSLIIEFHKDMDNAVTSAVRSRRYPIFQD